MQSAQRFRESANEEGKEGKKDNHRRSCLLFTDDLYQPCSKQCKENNWREIGDLSGAPIENLEYIRSGKEREKSDNFSGEK